MHQALLITFTYRDIHSLLIQIGVRLAWAWTNKSKLFIKILTFLSEETAVRVNLDYLFIYKNMKGRTFL
jgi:hypothetical protein